MSLKREKKIEKDTKKYRQGENIKEIKTVQKEIWMRFGIQMMAADAGMDTTCPSPEIPNDSRKRPLDGDSDNGSTKRSHFSGESQ